MRPRIASQWLLAWVGSWSALACDHGANPAGAMAAGRCRAGWTVPNLPAPNVTHPQSYDLGDPDVVHDRVTGLSWQRTLDPASYQLVQAKAYCRALTLGRQHDWRLPTMIELASIADTSRSDPAADPTAFANTPSVPFWSSQTDVRNGGLGWYVFFKTGGVYVGNDIADPARVRCVRGPSLCTEAGANSYAIAGDVARDQGTGLAWQRGVDHAHFSWEEAKDHCGKLAAGGGGWRLPSLRELLTLVDVFRFEPAIDPAAFPDTPSEFYWSSSPSQSPAGTAWGVNFTRGSSGAALVGTTAHLRCVR